MFVPFIHGHLFWGFEMDGASRCRLRFVANNMVPKVYVSLVDLEVLMRGLTTVLILAAKAFFKLQRRKNSNWTHRTAQPTGYGTAPSRKPWGASGTGTGLSTSLETLNLKK